MNTKYISHTFYRLLLFFVGMFISTIIAKFSLDPDRKCSTGDVFVYIFYMFIFHFLWTIGLTIEAFILHKRKEFTKRNIDLFMAFAIPVFLLLIYIYFEIVNLLD